MTELSLCLRADPDRVSPRPHAEDHGGRVPAGDAGGGDAGGGGGPHHLPVSGPTAGASLPLPVRAVEQEEGGSGGGQLHQLHGAEAGRPAGPTGTTTPPLAPAPCF